jgi:hypothetical protein
LNLLTIQLNLFDNLIKLTNGQSSFSDFPQIQMLGFVINNLLKFENCHLNFYVIRYIRPVGVERMELA